ncbi:MAG: hypothetical protein QOJ26_1177 [Thermoplasmata archaeon]|nr:hypothetical protein [Thermoplasmata archaeon]
MNARPLLLAGALLATAIALVPDAAAYPPVCIERTVTQGSITAHVGQCDDQYVHVVDCSSGGAQRIYYSKDLGPANVLVDYCLPHTPPP